MAPTAHILLRNINAEKNNSNGTSASPNNGHGKYGNLPALEKLEIISARKLEISVNINISSRGILCVK